MTSLSELKPAGDAVDVTYHADAEIDFWLPPVIGTSAMQSELEEHFGAMVAEMLRRQKAR